MAFPTTMPADYTWFKEGDRNFISKDGKWYKRNSVNVKSYDLHESKGVNIHLWGDIGKTKAFNKILINVALVPKTNLNVLFSYYGNGAWAFPNSDFSGGTGMLLSGNNQWRQGNWSAQGVNNSRGYPLTWQSENDWTLRKDFVHTLEIQVLPVSDFTTVIKWDINYKAHNNRIGVLEGIVKTDIGLMRMEYIAINFTDVVIDGKIHVEVV